MNDSPGPSNGKARGSLNEAPGSAKGVAQSGRADPAALHRALDGVWRSPPGWRGWSAVNHTAMGKRFMLAALCFFLIGGVLAMLIRAQLATSHSGFLDSELYSQIFTMHGTVMMFLFAIPMLEGFAFYLLPKMLGSRDLAFPRLGAYAWWCYLFGGLILMAGMALGLAPSSGWFMYTPLAGNQYTPGINSDIWLIGITFAEISALCGAVELIATILKMRAPGMSLARMPIFAWYMLITAGMILVGFPPLILGSILLELERAFGLPFFTVELGGDNLLWQHLFWMFGHPEVYIIFLPAAGMVSTLIPTFARHPLVGHTWVVNAIVAMGFLSFGLWVHHMYAVGIPQLSLALFSAASMLVAIPTAIQFFSWIATLWSGKVRFGLPMLYLGGFLVIFVLGGLTGVMVALIPFNVQVHDTHFVVAHMHYVLIGGAVFPLMAAAYYWMPHLTGRMPSARLGSTAFWLVFVGFNLTFLPMHLTGLLGMPRRIFAYGQDSGWDTLNLLSSMGGFIQAIGFGIFLIDLVLHARKGDPARHNPWQAGTLEWAMPMPPPSYNFASIPDIPGRYPLWERPTLGGEIEGGRMWLAACPPPTRQTLSIEVITGEPRSVIHLPGPTWMPLYCGIATGVFFLALLFKTYVIALAAVAATVLLFAAWIWQLAPKGNPPRVAAGTGVDLPGHWAARGSPGWWGMACALAANTALLSSLIFGCLFLSLYAPNWPPPRRLDPDPWVWVMLGVPLAGLLVAALATPARGRGIAPQAAGVLCAAVALAAVGVLIHWLEAPTGHAYSALMLVVLVYIGLHLAVALLMALYALCRRALHAEAVCLEELRVQALWTGYTSLSGLGLLVLMLGLRGSA
ncbi:cytochrome c oxidase subunit I [Pusillimonas sp.]|uniref:cytochrome c oxidase subunit I n=1 Tax=Pusillimonas sp. TaxID=3040095 RepID=UPI0037C71DA1